MSAKGSQVIVVKKNAPGWPAMVSSNFAANQKAIKEQIKAIKGTTNNSYSRLSNPSESHTSAKASVTDADSAKAEVIGSQATATSLWLQKRYHTVSKETIPALKSSPFAPKLVRQCQNCQMLYTNFHACCEDDGGAATFGAAPKK